ncbi:MULTISPECIES: CE1759 family FMN reductase [Actinoalloteichus]|uniref:LLM-partnered FMN reductase, CE1759 family n=1 Tax=Actinoalloteichus fjordicus TaxID=1612552 RepID=A0AAC9LBM4_9PSEU|nr:MULTISPECIES: CE1759 family FMN reductase [Actinoalloteichus]APU14958.1 LLM-partnered FMN reductase, CE1759 family [Actinoalloteichus fjordicus]APU21028.1 LLM-partnered FMN reductase, CE1759 family [Actinoalloteichus sp. GBA129-24]
MSLGETPVHLVTVSAGTSEPSTTRMLADRAAHAVVTRLRESGRNVTTRTIEIAPIAAEVAQSLVSGLPGDTVQTAIEQLADADALIVSTPVYKAGISGLFKSFFDLVDNDLLIARPVLLAATAGSPRHAMVADDHLRPLFAFLRAIPAPTSLFAAPEDWSSGETTARIDRAARELVALVVSGVGRHIAGAGWHGYQHTFGGNATRAQRTAGDIDLDTDLMRLARGER